MLKLNLQAFKLTFEKIGFQTNIYLGKDRIIHRYKGDLMWPSMTIGVILYFIILGFIDFVKSKSVN
jgi:hypothetical protein